MQTIQTMKLHLHTTPEEAAPFKDTAVRYASACEFISQYVFDNGFVLNHMALQDALYQTVRSIFGLKSQMAVSTFKTVSARCQLLGTEVPSLRKRVLPFDAG